MVTEQKGRGVVLACQGGGSHTAFTAGVLQELLTRDDRDIRALSGTSGGGVCAFLAWSGLLVGGRHGRKLGIERLAQFWEQLKPQNAFERVLDDVWTDTLRVLGALGIVLEVSPYLSPFDARRGFCRLIEDTVPFDDVHISPTAPRLLISAANVKTGDFRVFRSHAIGKEPADHITSEVIMASAAVPTLFRAVHLGAHVYWDGLFAQNPPVRDLPDAARDEGPDGLPPDELWVVMINPMRRPGEPTRMDDIRDRRNELAANISFQQEIFFIGKINELARRDLLTGTAKEKYHPIKVRAITITMSDELAAELDYESKLSRNPVRLDTLMEHGIAQATRFLDALHRPDADDRTAIWSRDIWGRLKNRNWTPL